MRKCAFIRSVNLRVFIPSTPPRKAQKVYPQSTAQHDVGRWDLLLSGEAKGLCEIERSVRLKYNRGQLRALGKWGSPDPMSTLSCLLVKDKLVEGSLKQEMVKGWNKTTWTDADLLWLLWFPAGVILIICLKLTVRRHQIITQNMTSHFASVSWCVCVYGGRAVATKHKLKPWVSYLKAVSRLVPTLWVCTMPHATCIHTPYRTWVAGLRFMACIEAGSWNNAVVTKLEPHSPSVVSL